METHWARAGVEIVWERPKNFLRIFSSYYTARGQANLSTIAGEIKPPVFQVRSCFFFSKPLIAYYSSPKKMSLQR